MISYLCSRILWRRRRPDTWSAQSSRRDTSQGRTDGSSRSSSSRWSSLFPLLCDDLAWSVASLFPDVKVVSQASVIFQTSRSKASPWRRVPAPSECGGIKRTLCAGDVERWETKTRGVFEEISTGTWSTRAALAPNFIASLIKLCPSRFPFIATNNSLVLYICPANTNI